MTVKTKVDGLCGPRGGGGAKADVRDGSGQTSVTKMQTWPHTKLDQPARTLKTNCLAEETPFGSVYFV